MTVERNHFILEKIIDIALKAGNEIMKIYSVNFKVKYKSDRSPVTQADKASNEIICNELEHLNSILGIDIPILSEENKEVSYEIRKDWRLLWMVDPLDGTREFIKKNGEFTVNIALVEENKPVLGVVYAPSFDILYFASKYIGAYKLDKLGNCKSIGGLDFGKLNHKKLPKIRKDGKLIVVTSRSHMNIKTQTLIENLKKSSLFHNRSQLVTTSAGSSLKICMVAEGKADIYPRIGPTMEWDTAAAHAIALESNCNIYEYEEDLLTKKVDALKTLKYNKRDLHNPYFVVIRPDV